LDSVTVIPELFVTLIFETPPKTLTPLELVMLTFFEPMPIKLLLPVTIMPSPL
jgi:hypothetical protein